MFIVKILVDVTLQLISIVLDIRHRGLVVSQWSACALVLLLDRTLRGVVQSNADLLRKAERFIVSA
jgi:hypothetical protein